MGPPRRHGTTRLPTIFWWSTGRDAVGGPRAVNPNNWWAGFSVDLGHTFRWCALYRSGQVLLRRDYSGGIALVNPPDGATRQINFSQGITA